MIFVGPTRIRFCFCVKKFLSNVLFLLYIIFHFFLCFGLVLFCFVCLSFVSLFSWGGFIKNTRQNANYAISSERKL